MMQVETDEPEVIERVAAVDIGKAEVVCCARVSGPGRQRMQEVRTVSTMTAALLELGDWLAGRGVTRVVMEATSDYWRAPFYLLEDRFETWLVNAHDVKHLPGRPKTDRLDAVWLCKVAERQMLRPSFVPPPAIRQLRDRTRYRVDLLAEEDVPSAVELRRRPVVRQAATTSSSCTAGATVPAISASSAARSFARCRWPLTRRNCLPASSMPAAAQRRAI